MCYRCDQIKEDIRELKERLSQTNCERSRQASRYTRWYEQNREAKKKSALDRYHRNKQGDAARA